MVLRLAEVRTDHLALLRGYDVRSGGGAVGGRFLGPSSLFSLSSSLRCMSDTLKFWMLVSLLCVAFAMAEYMYACEVIRICRDGSRHVLYKMLAALVLLVDCLGFLGCMDEGMNDCIRYIYAWGPSPIAAICLGLLLNPFWGLMFGWLFIAGAGSSVFIPASLCDAIPQLVILKGLLMISFIPCAVAAPFMRARVMYQAPCRSWWKVVFVAYVTYWPIAILLPSALGR